MKKRILLGILCLIMLGCAYEGQRLGAYLSDPKTIITDPHFAKYKENLDGLERQYLREEISYEEYMRKKKEADDQYEWEVQERNKRMDQ